MVLIKFYLSSSFSESYLYSKFLYLLKLFKKQAMTKRLKYAAESLNVHELLEELRTKADKENTKGPVALIVGPTDVGKSTLTHSLLNLAASQGRCPFFIDLDVGQSSVSIPGTLSKLPVMNPCGRDKRFNEDELIVYFFGYKSPGHNLKFYFHLMHQLSLTLKGDLLTSGKNKSSGAIVDTCGWVTGSGYNAIIEAAESFEINILLVVGDKRLYNQLLNDISPDVKVIFIRKLRGVVKRNANIRRQNRENKVYEYFYGSRNELQPYIFDVSFSDVQIFRITAEKNSAEKQSFSNNLSIDQINVGPELLYQVLSISYADQIEDIKDSSVYGFISFIDLDFNNKMIKVLSPQPSPLPNKFLLLGDIVLDLPASR